MKCPSSTSWRTRCRPTKPLPPMTRMRLMLLPEESASVTSKRAGQVRPTASMVPRTLLNDGRVLNYSHALGGATRQDRAQARLQGGWLGAEDGGVVNRVRHHLLHVVARLPEGNGLDETAPSTGTVPRHRRARGGPALYAAAARTGLPSN